MTSEFQLGDWTVSPRLNEIRRGQAVRRLEPKTMDLLVYLAEHPGEVLSKEKLVEVLWPDRFVTDHSLTSALSDLRRALGDDPKKSDYIQTISRRGYRLLSPVSWAGEDQPIHVPVTVRREKTFVFAGVPVLALLIAISLWFWSWGVDADQVQYDNSRNLTWVLISQIQNITEKNTFNGVLEYALERELGNSKAISVVSRERVNDILQLMKQPLETPVTRALGREICLRDGEIAFLITGKLQKLGGTYFLSLDLLDPRLDRIVAATTVETSDPADLVRLMSQLSDWMRAEMGERLPSALDAAKLAKVSTPSLSALRRYTQAESLLKQSRDAAAEEILREVTVDDPEFASAHNLLAWTLWRQGAPRSEILGVAEQALRLADSATERERYFIRGSYYSMRGEYEKALGPYDALIQADPDHPWASGNLLAILSGLNRESEAVPYVIKRLELRSHDFGSNWLAAEKLASTEGDWLQAERFARRALELAATDSKLRSSWTFGNLKLMKAAKLWLDGDLEGVLLEGRNAISSTSLSRSEADRVRQQFADWLLVLGKLKEAEKLSSGSSLDLLGIGRISEGGTARWEPDRAHIRADLERWVQGGSLREPIRIANAIRAGELQIAERVLTLWEAREYASHEGLSWGKALRGAILLERGDTSQALPMLREAFAGGPQGWPTSFFAAEYLALALEKLGWREEAIEVLEQASRHRNAAALRAGGVSWLKIRYQLRQLYRKSGRTSQAEEVETQLRELLRLADPDHPLLGGPLNHTNPTQFGL